MTIFTKRSLLGAAFGLALAVAGGTLPAQAAEGYPSGPITMLVGYGAGGQTDLVARAAAQVLSGELGVPVNVVNMPGAGGSVAAHELMKSKPDGQTLLFHSNSVVNSAPFIMERVNFKPDDFEYAGMITAYQVGLAASKDAPFNTLPEYVAWAKEHPGSSYGALSPEARMYINRIMEKDGIQVNIVPLKSGGEMLNALLGRQVELAFSGGIHFRNPDELKTISALTTFRQPSAPDVATIEEDGYPLAMDTRTTLFLPKGTPRDILDKLGAALKTAVTDENFQKITESANIPIMYLGVDEAYAEMNSTYEKHKKILSK